MAVIATTFSPEFTVFPWEGSPGQAESIRPIGELIANIRDGDVPLTGVGDSQLVRADVTLPVNFTYALTGASVNIITAGVPADNNWDALASMIFFDTVSGGNQTMEWGIGWRSHGVTSIDSNSAQMYCPGCPLPTFLQVGGSLWQSRFTNPTTNDIEATFNMTFRFLMFTISQRFDSLVNTPQLNR